MDWMSKFQQIWRELEAPYDLHSFNLISFSICLFFFLLVLQKLMYFRAGKKTKLPPSPPKLPIIGNLHQLGTLPHQSLAALSKKYGPLMLLKLGQIPTLVVSSAKMAKEVMKTHDIKFSNRHKITAAKILVYGCQDLAFAPYGEYWRQAKKMSVLELFSAKRVESFQYVREEEVGVLIQRIRRACGGGESVNFNQLLASVSSNIVSRCVLGEKFEEENGKMRFGEVSRRFLMAFSEFCLGDFFPALRCVDVLRGWIRELKRTAKTLDGLFDEIIEEHKTRMSTGSISDDRKDFLDIMLQLQQDGKLDYHFTQDNLKALLLDMFIGGSDTTATSFEWAITELMRNQAAMKKVQEEVRTIVGKKPKIEMEDIGKMEYLHCVVKESLRLHPPVPLLVPRESLGDVEIEGYHIPSKTSVFVNVWAIQRDPKTWERPNEFVPERFIENSTDYKGHDFEFIPFGSGRRMCPGISFAIAFGEYAVANLLYWFDWKLPDGCVLDVEEENGITVRKKKPLHLKPVLYI